MNSNSEFILVKLLLTIFRMQARAMCSVPEEPENVQFLIGTQTLKFDNQVSLLTLDEDTNQVSKQSFVHPAGEIWQISSCPSDRRILSTCYTAVDSGRSVCGCNIWSIGDSDSEQPSQNLELLCSLDIESPSSVCCYYWQPIGSGGKGKAFVIFDKNLAVVDTGASGKQCVIETTVALEPKVQHKFGVGKWDPHYNCNTIATAVDTAIKGPTFCIEAAHVPVIRDLDFNPNRQYILASAGDDCKVKFWDVRNAEKPVSVIARHSHWVWCVRYNPIHDQLLLSCSSDARVLLHCAASISSEPMGTEDLDETDDIETKYRF